MDFSLKTGTVWKRAWKYKGRYLLILPAFAATLLFKYYPMYGIILAFKDFKARSGIMGSAWANPWYRHFQVLFKDPQFTSALGNTIIVSVFNITVPTLCCISLALMLNEVRNSAFKRIVQTISYLPHFLSWIVLSGIIFTLFSSSYGIVNNFLASAFDGFKWSALSNPGTFRVLLYASYIWKSVGYGSIIYLAAITGVSPELYEAAIVDGASRWQRVWHITIQGIRSTILLLFILDCANILNSNFDQIFNLIGPSVLSTGDVIETFVYRQGIKQRMYDYATAVGLFKNMVGVALMLIVNLIVKRFGEDGIM